MEDELERLLKAVRDLDGLDERERTAMHAWRGAFVRVGSIHHSHSGQCPMFGKAECEWLDDWQAFYGDKAVRLGFFEFEDLGRANERLPGARQDLEWREYRIEMTPLGFEALKLHDELWEAALRLRPPPAERQRAAR